MRTMLILTFLIVVNPTFGWDAHTHRTLTYLSLDALPETLPAWLRDADFAHRTAFTANQPDRFRGWRSDILNHVNYPEHFLDAELLEQFGLTLETLPKLRREYVRALVIAKHVHPEQVDPYDSTKDPSRVQEWPGFLLHAIAEEYAQWCAALNQVRILEEIAEPARQHQLTQARAIALYHLGMLAHFVQDTAQPLHTTKHFNGWVGPNPESYTTDKKFHKYIDQGVIAHHGFTYANLRLNKTVEIRIADPRDPWEDVLAYFKRSFEQVEPLYRLERDDKLNGPEGKQFIESRLLDAASMLRALIVAAYEVTEPTNEQIVKWKFYNGFDAKKLPKN